MTLKTSNKTRRRLFALALGLSASAAPLLGHAWDENWPNEPEDKTVEFPASLEDKLAGLSAEQREFVSSWNLTKDFVESPEKLVEAFEKRDTEQVKAYVEAMMWVKEQQRFMEGRDQATIPLNTDAPNFKNHTVRRPKSFDPEREAGPVDLSRYGSSSRSIGIPTFAGAPVAFTPEDLKAGEVDVAIVGAPLNMGGGWRDADKGPMALRPFGRRSRMGGNDQYTQVNPSSVLNIVDYGDIAIDNFNTERSVQHVREVVREIAETGAIPFIVGGDHSLEYPNVAALVDVYGKGNISVIHFDAHSDISRDRAHLIDHGQPIYRLLSEDLMTGKDYAQVGLRSTGPNESQFRWARNQGFKYHSMAEVEKYGWDHVMARIVNELPEGRKLHISFDVDVLDPTFISGTGTPVSGGITPREAIPVIRKLCARSDVVGFDIVEIAPGLDPGYTKTTALHSSAILQACLTGIAMRREGYEPDYLNPVSTDHAQDNYHEEQQQ